MQPSEYKEVYFGHYCKVCRYFKTDSADDPCDECLNNPANLYSNKPVNFKLQEGKNEPVKTYGPNGIIFK